MKHREGPRPDPKPLLVRSSRLRFPAGVPARHRWDDALGHGSFGCMVGLPPEWGCPLVTLAVGAPAILIGGQGLALLGSGDGEVAVGRGRAFGLLPGQFRLESVEAPFSGEMPLLLLLMLTEAALERAFEDGKLWYLLLKSAATKPAQGIMAPPVGGIHHLPSFTTEGPPLAMTRRDRLGDGMLACMGGQCFQWDFYKFLSVGPCHHLVGRECAEPPPRFRVPSFGGDGGPPDREASATGPENGKEQSAAIPVGINAMAACEDAKKCA